MGGLFPNKTILIMKPFEAEQLVTRKRCYVIIASIWTIGCLLVTVNFPVHVTVNAVTCTCSIPRNDHVVKAGHLTFVVVCVVLPISLIIYGTVRIFIVVDGRFPLLNNRSLLATTPTETSVSSRFKRYDRQKVSCTLAYAVIDNVTFCVRKEDQ